MSNPWDDPVKAVNEGLESPDPEIREKALQATYAWNAWIHAYHDFVEGTP